MRDLNATEDEELRVRFTYHAPTPEQIPIYQEIRALGKDVATYVLQHVPDSRERALALTNIEQAIMWANAAVARRS